MMYAFLLCEYRKNHFEKTVNWKLEYGNKMSGFTQYHIFTTKYQVKICYCLFSDYAN